MTKKDMPDSSLPGRVYDAAGLVDCRTGSVVSREILSGDSGNVTVFAFDRGQSLSEHTAPFDAMVLGLDGEAEFRLGGEPKRIKPGDMLVMPADVPHAMKALTRFKMLLVMIKK